MEHDLLDYFTDSGDTRKNVKVTIYPNGVSARFENRRISAYKRPDGACDISLVTIDGSIAKRAQTVPIRNCGVCTTMGLSPESLEVLAYVLSQYINHKYHCS